MTETPRAQRTASELKSAARRLLTRKSYAEIKITDITAEAGKAAGSFYRHFTDKDALMKALINDFEAAVHTQVVALAGRQHHLATRDDVHNHVKAYWVSYRDHLPEMAGIFQASMLNEEFRLLHRGVRERHIDVWAQHIAEIQGSTTAKGRRRARLAALSVVCMLEYFCYDQLRGENSADDATAIQTLTDMITDGILGTTPPQRGS